MIPPMSLLMLAAVTPDDVEIQIIDERFEMIDFDQIVDLVGISVVTKTADRAYKIAGQFRKRGIKVIMGGIHPTVLPKESIQFADVVVIGEGERYGQKYWMILREECWRLFITAAMPMILLSIRGQKDQHYLIQNNI
ncbi:MAG: cobalamin-dependent protein [Desulfobacterales bacterium]|nr:cobalamin-dependent protein [Desulfobacterales bacterium]